MDLTTIGRGDTRQIYDDACHVVLGYLVCAASRSGEFILSSLRPEDWERDNYRAIFQAAGALRADGLPVDLATLKARMLPEYGELLDAAATIYDSAADLRSAVATMQLIQRQKRMLELSGTIQSRILLGDDPAEIRPEVQNLLATCTGTQMVERAGPVDMATAFLTQLDRTPVYIDWGFDKFNNFISTESEDSEGLYFILGARPSVGKTALGLQLAVAMAKGKKVNFYSLETGQKRAMERIASMLSLVDFGTIRRHQCTPAELQAVVRHLHDFSKSQFNFIEASGWGVDKLVDDALNSGAKIIFVDYLQLLSADRQLDKDDYRRVSYISRKLQQLARKGVIVIALSQLSRNNSGEGAPRLTDLRSSGQIEQDADIVTFLYRPDKKDFPEFEIFPDEEWDEECEFLRIFEIAKNRDGPLGKVKMWFDGATQHFSQTWDNYYQPIQKMEE